MALWRYHEWHFSWESVRFGRKNRQKWSVLVEKVVIYRVKEITAGDGSILRSIISTSPSASSCTCVTSCRARFHHHQHNHRQHLQRIMETITIIKHNGTIFISSIKEKINFVDYSRDNKTILVSFSVGEASRYFPINHLGFFSFLTRIDQYHWC